MLASESYPLSFHRLCFAFYVLGRQSQNWSWSICYLISTLVVDSNASLPAQNKKEGKEVEGRGDGEKEADRTNLGSGEKQNTVSVVCMKGGLGTNTGQSVRVSSAPCTMPPTSILSLSPNCA